MEENKVEIAQEEQVKNEAPNAEVSEEKTAEARDGQGHRNNNRRDFHGKKPFRRDRRSEPKEFEERIVYINRVTKVVKGGKRMKFTALVAIGDGKGRYAFGTGKSGEVPDAIKKAVDAAKKKVKTIHMTRAGTITHDVIGKFGATEVFLKPAKEGTGIIAGGPVRAILELSGIRNVYSKVYGSRTAINIIRATDNALSQLKNYKGVQELRGLSTKEAE